MVNLLEFDRDGLAAFCEQLGEKRFRATQLFRWIHQRGERDFARDVRPGQVAARQARRRAPRSRRCRSSSEQVAADGTIKWLFDVGAGDAVETVFIPEADRGTLCISSQAGCAVGCRFCSTGHQGFSRNLTHRRDRRPALARRVSSCAGASACADGERAITNVVMMGMGEPLQNYAALRAGAAHDARRPRLRPVAPPRHGVDLGRGADDRPPARRLPGRAGGVAACARRRAARRARAAEPQVPDRRAAGRLRALPRRARRATSSPSSTACSTASTTRRAAGAASWSRWSTRPRLPCKFNLIPFNPFPASGLKRSPRERVAAFAARAAGRRHRRPPCARRAATTSPPPAASSPAKCRTARASPSGACARRRCASPRRHRGAAPPSRRHGDAAHDDAPALARRCCSLPALAALLAACAAPTRGRAPPANEIARPRHRVRRARGAEARARAHGARRRPISAAAR